MKISQKLPNSRRWPPPHQGPEPSVLTIREIARRHQLAEKRASAISRLPEFPAAIVVGDGHRPRRYFRTTEVDKYFGVTPTTGGSR